MDSSALNTPKSQIGKLLIYYQCLLAIGIVAIFFTKLDIYLEQKGFLLPLYWLIGFIAASAPLWFLITDKIKHLLLPVLSWCIAYLGINAFTIVADRDIPDIQLFEDRIRSLIFLLFALFIFSEHTLVRTCVKVSMLIITIINVGCYAYEIFNPLAFGALHTLGRPAGFYIDSNEAGCALILGLIFTIDLIKPQFRMLFASYVGIGVVLTFSRGAMLSWLITVIILSILKIIPRFQLIYLITGITIVFLTLKTQINTLAYLKNTDGSPLFNQDVLARIEWILNPTSESQDLSRFYLLENAWQKFSDSPIFGQGLGGSASKVSVSNFDGSAQRPHNTYLTNMVEHGILGFFILPTLILSVIWKVRGKMRKTAIPFAIFFLVWGLFSHTILSSFFILLSFAFMATLTKQSKVDSV